MGLALKNSQLMASFCRDFLLIEGRVFLPWPRAFIESKLHSSWTPCRVLISSGSVRPGGPLEKELAKSIEEHLRVFTLMRDQQLSQVASIGAVLWQVLQAGHKILVAGNGGSAADSQHFAAELVGRYLAERPGLAALALTTDSSALTAVANDFGYDQVFSRQVQGLGKRGDALIAISTSGNSRNLVLALEQAAPKGLVTIALLGKDGGAMKDLAKHVLVVPSKETPRIQEAHEWVLHSWCDLIDRFHG